VSERKEGNERRGKERERVSPERGKRGGGKDARERRVRFEEDGKDERGNDEKVVLETHLNVRQRELNLPIDSSRSNERRIEGFDLVGRHDDLDVSSRVESVELVEKLQHRSLNLSFSSRG